MCPGAQAQCDRTDIDASSGRVTIRVTTVGRGSPQQEDTNHATHHNACPPVGNRSRFRSRNSCPATLGTGKGTGIHWYWGTGLPHTGGYCACAGRGRSPTASRRVPCVRGRGPASGGVWICAGCGRGILRPLLSALETSSPPLASLVILLSWDHALPCQCGREGLFISAGPRPSPIPPAKPVRQLCCMPRGVVRRASMHNLCSAPLATDTRATMSMYFGKSCVDGWEV